MKTINIAKDFSDTPLGRYKTDGDFSGERFRDEMLSPALHADEVHVEISGVEGYGSSFLEEAFGGLVRLGEFTADQLSKRLKVTASDPDFEAYRHLIWKYIKDARREQ